jgi:hypothetical protein
MVHAARSKAGCIMESVVTLDELAYRIGVECAGARRTGPPR